jgi:DNA-binding PadR family transcriptional regulator
MDADGTSATRFEISLGTLYPLLQRMARLGWWKSKTNPPRSRTRKDYRFNEKGQKVLGVIRAQITTPYDHVVREGEQKGKQ